MTRLLALLATATFALTTIGCAEEVPTEKAGRQIDEAMEEAAEGAQEAVDEMEKAAEEATDS